MKISTVQYYSAYFIINTHNKDIKEVNISMKILNKIFYIIANILEVLLLGGAYVVNYFTRAKMGMARFVPHKNYMWEITYDMNKLKYISMIILIVLMILVLILYLKRKLKLKKCVLKMNIIMVILVVIFCGFNFIYSTSELRAFYFISAMVGVATLIQIIKTLCAVFICTDK